MKNELLKHLLAFTKKTLVVMINLANIASTFLFDVMFKVVETRIPL